MSEEIKRILQRVERKILNFGLQVADVTNMFDGIISDVNDILDNIDKTKKLIKDEEAESEQN